MSALAALSYLLDNQPELGASGNVLFLRARPNPCLARFEGRLTCEQTWKPHADALKEAGFENTRAPEGIFQTVLLLPTRQRETIFADIARAYDFLEENGTLIVALHNDWGARRTEQSLEEIAGDVQTLSKHHSRVFWTIKKSAWDAEKLAIWRDGAALRRAIDGRFWSCPGLFNWDCIDKGSKLLTDHLPITVGGKAADLGCSWGYLSEFLLRNCPNINSLDAYDADLVALEAARRNLGLVPTRVKSRLHWKNVAAGLGETTFDLVVMNPPFHDGGRDADPMIGLKFITAAAQSLTANGDLWLVANKHLPYENLMTDAFEHSRLIIEANGFKVLHGAKPKASVMMHRRRSRR